MPAIRDTRLQLPGRGGIEAAPLARFLQAMNDSYNGYIAFEGLISRARRQDYRYRGEPYGDERFFDYWFRAGMFFEGPQVDPEAFVSASERLLVEKVALSSPGSWVFLGVDKSLEVVRQYLDDRHRRKQDRDFRDKQVERRLGLENDLVEIEVVRQQIELGREVGLAEDDLQRLARRLMESPLEELGELQDRGVIDGSKAELRRPELPEGDH